MDVNSMFLIYGRINDRLVLMARHLKDWEVTAKAKELAKKSRGGEILILEETPERHSWQPAREKALEAIKRCVAKKGERRL